MNSEALISNVPPKNLKELIVNIYNCHDSNSTYANTLISILKKYHFWPNIKVKKFKNNDDLVLLHNNYKMGATAGEYKELYEECRSIVLDFTLSCNNNVVVTYANSVPRRISYEEYMSTLYNETDKCYEAYDGTIITVYNYKNKWYFGTSSCPDANSSKFSHPTKSHGLMFDEVLYKYYSRYQEILNMLQGLTQEEISQKLREMFVSNLNIEDAYEFVLIHKENKHIVDYTDVLGEDYKELVHINTKNRTTLYEYDSNSSSIQDLFNLGVKYPSFFSQVVDGNNYISNNITYGLIIKKNVGQGVTKLYKISSNYINHREETDPCHPNLWMNILEVYMKNKQNYTIKDYIATYRPNIQLPIDNNGKEIDPTYLVHTIISTIKDSLYGYYKSTTTYNPKYKRFKMIKELDKQFAPIIQYHLAQLRNLQTNIFSKKLITSSNIYYYLCQCNDVKNIKTLIQFFASNSINEMQPRTSMCFAIMNSLIS